jgi:4-hydroxybenzoate polyprenyltransferase
MAPLIELVRVRQWIKNAFVLAPLFFGAVFFDPAAIYKGMVAFAAFCLIASAVYILNDWRDIEADRVHEKKRLRPLPSGRVSVPVALTMMVLLAGGSAALIYFGRLPLGFAAIVLAYVAINVGYSMGLKQIAVLELFLLSSGFVLRLLAGGVAIGVELSPWIIIATGCVAMLIAVGKRRGDIVQQNDKQAMRASLAGYNLAYLDGVLSMLTSATLIVYLLFCVSPYATQKYSQYVLFTSLPVAFGILRYVQLLKVYGEGEAPTDLVTKDRPLMATVVVFLIMFGALVYKGRL